MHGGATAPPGVPPDLFDFDYGPAPSFLWESGNSIAIDGASSACTKGCLNGTKPSLVAMFMKSPDRSSDHVSQLNPDAHVRRNQKNTLNEVAIGGCVLCGFAYKPFVLLPHSVVLTTVPVVRDHDSRSTAPRFLCSHPVGNTETVQ